MVQAKEKKIRGVNELEDLRVKYSEEVGNLLKEGKTPQELRRISELRQEITLIRDELAVSKNLEYLEERRGKLKALKEAEVASQGFYNEMMGLVKEVIPKLHELEPSITAIAKAQWSLGNSITQVKGHVSHFSKNYGERVEVKVTPIGIIHRISPAAILSYISVLEELLKEGK